jgi:PAP2 superfamily
MTKSARPSGLALRFAAVELLLWTTLYGLYLLVRGLSIASEDEAVANARKIVDAEREAGLYVEASVQAALAPLHTVASAYYVLGFAPLLAGLLVWLAVRHRDTYRELRLLLLVSIAIAVAIHVALPVAPPRLIPELGLVDTVRLDRDGSSFAGVPYNPYAAMPSMHVGWSLLAGAFALRAAGARPLRWLLFAHPVLMIVAVTVTGNHFLLDSVAGVAVAVAAVVALALWRLEPEPSAVPLRQ